MPKSDDDDVVLVDIEAIPSDETLDRAPERSVTLIRGIANNPVATAIMTMNGYGPEDHAEGFSLIAATAALPPTAITIQHDRSTADAIGSLDRWDNENFPIIKTALKRKFAPQRAALFANLGVADGLASVLGVEKLLARLALLASGKLTDDKENDMKANAALEKRGYTAAERNRLQDLVITAKALPEPFFESPETTAARKEARRAALLELHGWWQEWAIVARKKIGRRDLLINLGLGERKRSAKTKVDEDSTDDKKDPSAKE